MYEPNGGHHTGLESFQTGDLIPHSSALRLRMVEDPVMLQHPLKGNALGRVALQHLQVRRASIWLTPIS